MVSVHSSCSPWRSGYAATSGSTTGGGVWLARIQSLHLLTEFVLFIRTEWASYGLRTNLAGWLFLQIVPLVPDHTPLVLLSLDTYLFQRQSWVNWSRGAWAAKLRIPTLRLLRATDVLPKAERPTGLRLLLTFLRAGHCPFLPIHCFSLQCILVSK